MGMSLPSRSARRDDSTGIVRCARFARMIQITRRADVKWITVRHSVAARCLAGAQDPSAVGCEAPSWPDSPGWDLSQKPLYRPLAPHLRGGWLVFQSAKSGEG